jgi:tetratricopeptide (TPR) repeat protein
VNRELSTRVPLVAFSLVLLIAGCASLGAKKHFGAAQKAEQQGDLATAIKEYEAALQQQPSNAEYKGALERAKRSAADAHVAAARDSEAKSDWQGAIEHWQGALQFAPERSGELGARLELAKLRTKRSDPLEFFQATERLAKALPNDQDAQRALEEARSEAFRYYAKLAETFFDAGAFAQAYEAFESAKKVKPNDEAFKGLKYRISRARYLEALGDQKMKAGDSLAAYRAYEDAASSAELPGLDRKIDRARRGAGSLIEQLEQARAYEKLQKWEDAAELYTLIRERSDAPPEVSKAAEHARLESAKIRAERAASFASQGMADKATAAFALALEHTDGAPQTLELLKSGLEAVQVGRAGEALQKFQAAQKGSPGLPVVDAALKVAAAKAKSEFEAAKAQAEQDPAEAMVRVARLAAFRDRLPGYDQVRAQLVKRAFAVLLDRAETKASEGQGPQAAELFATALEIAKPPATVRAQLDAGANALRAGDYQKAEETLEALRKSDEKSKLAKTGVAIAQGLRLFDLRREARAAEASDDTLRAAAAYREILAIRPDDKEAKGALAELGPELAKSSIAAADAHRSAGRNGSAYVYYKRALELDPTNAHANEALTALAGAFELRPEPVAWVARVVRGGRLGDSCPGAEKDVRERMILYLTRTRNLGADYLGPDQTKEVDEKKRPAPPIELLSALEHCTATESGGNVALTIQVRIAGKVVAEERVGAAFNPSSLPKDEAEGGIDTAKVLGSILKECARLAANVAQKHASALKDWRVTEAKARIQAGDEEGAAASYAVLSMSSEKLSASEREALRELERFILARFR